MVRRVASEATGWIDEDKGIGQLNWDAPEHLARSQLEMEKLFPTVALAAPESPDPLPFSGRGLDIEALTFPDPLGGAALDGAQFLNRRLFNDALLVCHQGSVVHESYRGGMGPQDRHVLHSCSKTLAAMLVAIAIAEGRLQRKNPITDYLPELAGLPAWRGVTLQHVLDMRAGIAYSEDYRDPKAHYWSYARAAGYYPPLEGEEAVGVRTWIAQNLTRRQSEPGSEFVYNSTLTNVLGMVLEAVYGEGLAQLLEQKVFRKVGPEAEAYFNTDPKGFPIAEGQISMRLRDFARVAMLMSSGGRNRDGEQVIPEEFIAGLVVPDEAARRAYHRPNTDPVFPCGQYRDQVWVLDPEREQFTMLGIHGQFAWCDLRRELLLVGFGSYPQQDGELMMRTLNVLWQTVGSQYE